MRTFLVMIIFVATGGTSLAQDLGSSREIPPKNSMTHSYVPPEECRQGGDTVDDATIITGLPYSHSGTTYGFLNDYDEACLWSSTSPDVVYSFTPNQTMMVTVDLCGSEYDTKTYVYDEDLFMIACNDDFYIDDDCGMYVSKIEYVELTGGELYYIVIDGYGGDSGFYELMVTEFIIIQLECDADAVDEGEPELHDGYFDEYNCGCNAEGIDPLFQDINWTNDADGFPPYDGYAWLCGESGWFLSSGGQRNRDTDWYRVFALQDGVMEFTVESAYPCHLFKLAPLDCETVDIELEAICNFAEPATLAFPVTAGEEIWLWVGPTTFSGPVNEFTYFMTVSNNQFVVVPVEGVNWGEVKALYR